MTRFFSLLIVTTLAIPATARQHYADSSNGEHAMGMDMHSMHHGPADLRAEVESVVHRLFEGMRAGDSTLVSSVVAPGIDLVTTFTRDDVPGQRRSPMTAFIEAVGTPHEQVWDERIWNLRVDVRDNLAAAWMDYAFYLDDTFSHCGVNAMQLARRAGGNWEIIALADTRRPPDQCELPEEIRNR